MTARSRGSLTPRPRRESERSASRSRCGRTFAIWRRGDRRANCSSVFTIAGGRAIGRSESAKRLGSRESPRTVNAVHSTLAVEAGETSRGRGHTRSRVVQDHREELCPSRGSGERTAGARFVCWMEARLVLRSARSEPRPSPTACQGNRSELRSARHSGRGEGVEAGALNQAAPAQLLPVRVGSPCGQRGGKAALPTSR